MESREESLMSEENNAFVAPQLRQLRCTRQWWRKQVVPYEYNSELVPIPLPTQCTSRMALRSVEPWIGIRMCAVRMIESMMI